MASKIAVLLILTALFLFAQVYSLCGAIGSIASLGEINDVPAIAAMMPAKRDKIDDIDDLEDIVPVDPFLLSCQVRVESILRTAQAWTVLLLFTAFGCIPLTALSLSKGKPLTRGGTGTGPRSSPPLWLLKRSLLI